MYARTVHAATPSSEVRTVMSWPVATVDGAASLAEVAEELAADEVGALCVLEHGRLAGIVSERDVVVYVAGGTDPGHVTAADLMSSELVTVAPDDPVALAARTMYDAEVRHLPVVDDGRIAGIVSMRDLFTVLADGHPEGQVLLVGRGQRILVVGE